MQKAAGRVPNDPWLSVNRSSNFYNPIRINSSAELLLFSCITTNQLSQLSTLPEINLLLMTCKLNTFSVFTNHFEKIKELFLYK